MKNGLAIVVVLLAACAAPKTFRVYSTAEKSAIKAAQKVVDKKRDQAQVLILTDSGQMVVKLYNETPLHRDNFLHKVTSGFYDSLLFHRVIKNFMIQGGDPESKYAESFKMLGAGSATGPRISAEIKPEAGLLHKRGALAAARDGNPEKASSNCQFYIVHRGVWRADALDSFATARNIKINDQQKLLYTTVGGTPHLDGNYTVFGELVTGWEVLDKIALTATAKGDKPLQNIRMKMFLLYLPKSLRK